MSEPTVDIQVTKVSAKVFRFQAIVKGKVYHRTYMGYKLSDSFEMFKKWLKEQGT